MERLHDSDPKSIGPYQVIGRLGSGGMGTVYLCATPGGRRLAVKVIRPELADDSLFRTRFRREVASAQLVRSHVTAGVVDSDTESPTQPWLATVFLDGPTLSAAVEQSPLAEPELRRLAAALAEALQYIHRAGLVHRDLKPSNIILAADGPMVIDFGIARAVDATALTTTNLRVGSAGYMAPEQIRSDAARPESDIFALGAVLAYAATGRPPFGTGPTDAVQFRVLHEEPNLDGVPPNLRSLIAACLAKDPGQRPTPDLILQETTGGPATLVLGQTLFGEPALPEASRALTSPVGVAATRVETQVAPQFEPPVEVNGAVDQSLSESCPTLPPGPLEDQRKIKWVSQGWVRLAAAAFLIIGLVTIGLVMAIGYFKPPLRNLEGSGRYQDYVTILVKLGNPAAEDNNIVTPNPSNFANSEACNASPDEVAMKLKAVIEEHAAKAKYSTDPGALKPVLNVLMGQAVLVYVACPDKIDNFNQQLSRLSEAANGDVLFFSQIRQADIALSASGPGAS